MKRKSETPKKNVSFTSTKTTAGTAKTTAGTAKTTAGTAKATAKTAKRKSNQIVYLVGERHETCSREMWEAMRKLQRRTDFLINKKPFSRLIREIMQNYSVDLRITYEALEALQLIAETYLGDLFVDASACAAHAKRVTLTPEDIKLVGTLRQMWDPTFQ